jgi:hypothetical protein
MSISRLAVLVPPPIRPTEVGSLEQWQAVELELGLELPSDYRDFVFAYGTGLFASFYRIYNPFSAAKWINLSISIQRDCESVREIKRNWPDRVPYRIYPDHPGLLPFGNDENGNNYYWLTEGRPDSWPVVQDEVRGDGVRQHDFCMTDFLCEVLTGKIEALAGQYPKPEHLVFKQWTK